MADMTDRIPQLSDLRQLAELAATGNTEPDILATIAADVLRGQTFYWAVRNANAHAEESGS